MLPPDIFRRKHLAQGAGSLPGSGSRADPWCISFTHQRCRMCSGRLRESASLIGQFLIRQITPPPIQCDMTRRPVRACAIPWYTIGPGRLCMAKTVTTESSFLNAAFNRESGGHGERSSFSANAHPCISSDCQKRKSVRRHGAAFPPPTIADDEAAGTARSSALARGAGPERYRAPYSLPNPVHGWDH